VLCIEVLHQDDGISAEVDQSVIEVAYIARKDEKEMDINPKSIDHGFNIAWVRQVTVVLRVTNGSSVKAGKTCVKIERQG
jgi:hypothetical protein